MPETGVVITLLLCDVDNTFENVHLEGQEMINMRLNSLEMLRWLSTPRFRQVSSFGHPCRLYPQADICPYTWVNNQPPTSSLAGLVYTFARCTYK